MALSLARYLPRVGRAARTSGVASRVGSIGGRLSSSVGGILKTSGGALVGGGAAGYSISTLEQWTGTQDKNRQMLVLGGVALLAIYSVGQLFEIQVGD